MFGWATKRALKKGNATTFRFKIERVRYESDPYDKKHCIKAFKTYLPGKFDETATFKTNLAEFTNNKSLRPYSQIKIGIANEAYRELKRACGYSITRLNEHGYEDMEEIVTLQEALCAIYRRNNYDKEKLLFKYLYEQNREFVCNDCFNCSQQTYRVNNGEYKNCKLYLPQLALVNEK